MNLISSNDHEKSNSISIYHQQMKKNCVTQDKKHTDGKNTFDPLREAVIVTSPRSTSRTRRQNRRNRISDKERDRVSRDTSVRQDRRTWKSADTIVEESRRRHNPLDNVSVVLDTHGIPSMSSTVIPSSSSSSHSSVEYVYVKSTNLDSFVRLVHRQMFLEIRLGKLDSSNALWRTSQDHYQRHWTWYEFRSVRWTSTY